jgi:hypothetical protein
MLDTVLRTVFPVSPRRWAIALLPAPVAISVRISCSRAVSSGNGPVRGASKSRASYRVASTPLTPGIRRVHQHHVRALGELELTSDGAGTALYT